MGKRWRIKNENTAGYEGTQTSMLTSTAVSYQATDAAQVFPLAAAMQDAWEDVFVRLWSVSSSPEKACGECSKAPPLAHGGRNWLPLQLWLPPPQKRVRWSFLNQHRRRGGGRGGLKGNKQTSESSADERMPKSVWQGILSSARV